MGLLEEKVAEFEGQCEALTQRVAELELRAAVGENVNDKVEAIGLAYQIATRLTDIVARHLIGADQPGHRAEDEGDPRAEHEGRHDEAKRLGPALRAVVDVGRRGVHVPAQE